MNDRVISKGHRNQLEGAPIGPSWDNLSINISNTSKEI